VALRPIYLARAEPEGPENEIGPGPLGPGPPTRLDLVLNSGGTDLFYLLSAGGGPRISHPYPSAAAAMAPKSGGDVGGGGRINLSAGTLMSKKKLSKPAGVIRLKRWAVSESIRKARGVPFGS
jgi:hypothetical protein